MGGIDVFGVTEYPRRTGTVTRNPCGLLSLSRGSHYGDDLTVKTLLIVEYDYPCIHMGRFTSVLPRSGFSHGIFIGTGQLRGRRTKGAATDTLNRRPARRNPILHNFRKAKTAFSRFLPFHRADCC